MSELNNRNSSEHTNKKNGFICGVVEGFFYLFFSCSSLFSNKFN